LQDKPTGRSGSRGWNVSLKTRCKWVTDDELSKNYHDEEWGVPAHDDRKLFELLILEGAQAGLSWLTILRKRANYRQAFDGFNAKKMAEYNQKRVERLMQDRGIVRNQLKIMAAIENARAFLRVQEEHGSFDAYIWQFVGGEPKVNSWRIQEKVPTKTTESDAMSKDLAKRGFKFAGSTICYAFMQAVGMVNDHTTGCFRYSELSKREADRP
jgi:DNA-3-methyladenine glycosylase I